MWTTHLRKVHCPEYTVVTCVAFNFLEIVLFYTKTKRFYIFVKKVEQYFSVKSSLRLACAFITQTIVYFQQYFFWKCTTLCQHYLKNYNIMALSQEWRCILQQWLCTNIILTMRLIVIFQICSTRIWACNLHTHQIILIAMYQRKCLKLDGNKLVKHVLGLFVI